MLVVPLLATPSQILQSSLGGQAVKLAIYQKLLGMYMDVYVDDALIIGGVLCENENRIVRSIYLGFVGDLMFYDTQGSDDPTYSTLGTRFVLLYLEAQNLPNGAG